MAFFINAFKQHSEHANVPEGAKFTHGSTMRHVVGASVTSAIGLVALFFVDLVDIFFIGLLGESELAAAVGFAGSLIFFTTSIAIAGSIAVTSTVSRLLGAGNEHEAKQFFAHAVIYALIVSIPVAALLFAYAEPLLRWLGAEGQTLTYAVDYFRIIIPSFPFLAVGMAAGSVLRSQGNFQMSMYVTLIGGIVNAILDPIFIFALDLGLQGAAIATVGARLAIFATALYFVITRYSFWTNAITRCTLIQDLKQYNQVFIPASLSNIATPVGSAFVVAQMAQFGDGYVAGMSVTGRITPVLFGVVLALSGSIGPIVGQNLGAGLYDRVRQAFKDSLIFSWTYVLIACFILFLIQDVIITLFKLGPDGAAIVSFYSTFIAISFGFAAMVFIANATFNALGKATTATTINILRNLVFLVPFVYLGALWGGPYGILIGQALGLVCVSAIAYWLAWRGLYRLDKA